MKIVIETIPHDQHRYPTAGDWYYADEPTTPEVGAPTEKVLHIKVSNLSDRRREALIAIHELVEVILCEHDGVTQEAVDAFDMEFEKKRQERIDDAARKVTEPGVTSGEEALIAIEEPGDDEKAPYRDQHCFATGIERLLASRLGVGWKDYETEIERLP